MHIDAIIIEWFMYLFPENCFDDRNQCRPWRNSFYAAFRRGFHCLPNNLQIGIRNVKGLECSQDLQQQLLTNENDFNKVPKDKKIKSTLKLFL